MQRKSSDFINDRQRAYIEEFAEYIADTYSPRGIIDLENIAENYGITYSYGNYKEAFDGLIEHAYGKFHIYINIDRLEHPYTDRARFTFAHELGHYFIDNHRNALEKGLTPSHTSFTGFVSDNLIEREADFFASCLLLPKNRILKDSFKRKFEYKLIQELSKKYHTSITATAIRFATVGHHPIMVVCSVRNKIKWYWYSDKFPFWSLKYGKSKVPENTAAGEYYLKGIKYENTESLFADDWFNVYYDSDYNRPFFEHCLYGRNEVVVSIIWEK